MLIDSGFIQKSVKSCNRIEGKEQTKQHTGNLWVKYYKHIAELTFNFLEKKMALIIKIIK